MVIVVVMRYLLAGCRLSWRDLALVECRSDVSDLLDGDDQVIKYFELTEHQQRYKASDGERLTILIL